ncbi:DEAD/DEAH box helicase [Xanthobacter autotrophicus DSM 431]|uniref:DEAD/DEAH box helicase n=1 Tax=Xanthobacter nonsaccharivorans TaxID=3119912 RepID=UPI0037290B0B
MPRSAFDQLAEPVRRWIWQQKWPSLRDVQEKAIPAVLAGGDIVISARTAAGKTEAAFLPLLSRIASNGRSADGFAVLYVSPLKALINDQHRRLESLCEACDILLHKWHGDVSEDAKARARKRPSGLVLITPESLEALLVRRGREAPRLFSRLDAFVIDELHAFIGTERGMQLQSILNRIEVATGRERIDRIGLSATLGDMHLAAEALRPGAGGSVSIIEGVDEGNGLKLQIRGYAIERPASADDETQDGGDERRDPFGASSVPDRLASDLFRFLRGRSNLLFAGSRVNVEIYTDRLSEMCRANSFPNEFFAHHGNLAKAMREEVEHRLRDDPRPTTAVATMTLELGIDIGDVETVAQIGPGFSVASLRQRLGRSGRRPGKPAKLRIFVPEPVAGPGDHPVDRLHLGLVQSIAMVECLLENWCEPPADAGLHLSTLIHQILAAILQTGGLKPASAWQLLCGRGPFRNVDKGLFADLLRRMAHPDVRLIEQSPQGLLMIGETGEQIAESHELYAVFMTEKEYRIIHEARVLGTYPLSSPVAPNETLIFAGRRWRILDVDDHARVIAVQPTRAGKPPYFAGDGGAIHDKIVSKMQDILAGGNVFTYLDTEAVGLLNAARSAFRDLGLHERSVIPHGEGVLVFPWAGTRKLRTLLAALLASELKGSAAWHVIEIQEVDLEGVAHHLKRIADAPPPDGITLAARLAQPQLAKFDRFLSPELMNLVTAKERLDIPELPSVASATLRNLSRVV